MTTAIARIRKEGSLTWWAELWKPRTRIDPLVPMATLRDPRDPDSPFPTHHRIGLKLCLTRRGARKAAQRMLARHQAGLHPEHDKQLVEEIT